MSLNHNFFHHISFSNQNCLLNLFMLLVFLIYKYEKINTELRKINQVSKFQFILISDKRIFKIRLYSTISNKQNPKLKLVAYWPIKFFQKMRYLLCASVHSLIVSSTPAEAKVSLQESYRTL